MSKGENQRSKLPILNRDDVKDSLDTELVIIMILSAFMAVGILQLLISRRQGFENIKIPKLTQNMLNPIKTSA